MCLKLLDAFLHVCIHHILRVLEFLRCGEATDQLTRLIQIGPVVLWKGILALPRVDPGALLLLITAVLSSSGLWRGRLMCVNLFLRGLSIQIFLRLDQPFLALLI